MKILLRALRFTVVLLSAFAMNAHGALDHDSVKVSANFAETKVAGGFGDFTPELAYDGVLEPTSSWRAEPHGDVFPWLQFSFAEPVSLRAIDIHFLSGGQRKYIIDVLVSADTEPQTWQKLIDYEPSNPSFGPATIFQFPDTEVRHLRIVGHGNSSEKFPHWTNIVEVRFIEAADD